MKRTLILLVAAGLLLLSSSGCSIGYSPTDSSDALRDDDNDGLNNVEEYGLGTDPGNPDTDNDGLPDGWEWDYGLDPTDASDADNDEDYANGEEYASFLAVSGPHYTNYDEYYYYWVCPHNCGYAGFYHTNPLNPDTDGDGVLDPDSFNPPLFYCGCMAWRYTDPWPHIFGDCVKDGQDPEDEGPQHDHDQDDDDDDQGEDDDDQGDADGDGVSDNMELFIGTDPYNPDTDGDKLLDGQEVNLGLDPNDWDTDNDLLSDGSELGVMETSTDGHFVDTDNDGVLY